MINFEDMYYLVQIQKKRYGSTRPTDVLTRGLVCLLVFLSLVGDPTPTMGEMGPPRPAGAQPADLILKGGRIYTMNPLQPRGEALAVRDGRIVFVGPDTGVEGFQDRRTRVVDLAGKMVLPGFQDSHIHLLEGGLESGQCLLNGLTTSDQVLAAIRKYAAAHPKKTWILGSGWELPVFPDGNPTREVLDQLVPDRPACFASADGHSAWANSRALELAGITAATPDPADGRIERRPGSRDPAGTLRESAMDAMYEVIPAATAKERRQGLRLAQAQALAFGITSVIDARTDEAFLRTYDEFDRRGELRIKVWASVPVDAEKGPEQVPALARLRRKYGGPHLRVTAAKIFADGVIESHTAALLSPYLDRPGDLGKPVFETENLSRLAVALEKAGFQIHFHAIGDAGIRMALDALEAARRANGPLDLRHQLAHIELIDPADLPRFRELGVVADFQALWAYADPYIVKLTQPILGPERSGRLYQIGSVRRTGAVVAGGSDWTVSSMNPLEAIQVAVTRKDPQNPRDTAWLPGERISLHDALAAYTRSGAWLTHREGTAGSLEVGRVADLVVLDRDLFDHPPEEIAAARVLMTFIDGRLAWSAGRESPPR